jgi:hypothetical protein
MSRCAGAGLSLLPPFERGKLSLQELQEVHHMATRKPTQQDREDAQIDKLFADLGAQPPQLSDEERIELENRFTSHEVEAWRRLLLGTLTQSGAELVKAAKGDAELAVDMQCAAEQAKWYAERLREFACVIESAGRRIGLALCSRPDLEAIQAAAAASRDRSEADTWKVTVH